MKKRRKAAIIFVCIIASYMLLPVSAQQKIINMPPDAIPEEGGIVKARDKITLLPGFNFDAPPNTSLRIDKNMICPAEYLTTAPDPSNRDIKDNPVVGAIAGNFNVTPTGAATYTIPIEISPGTNGMQPSIAITYNSQGGNGPLGMGWGLAGMSAITRTGSNIYYDGEVKGIQFNAKGNFILDGSRLIKTGVTSDGDYIFKKEKYDFSKIIGHKNGNTFNGFTVYTKNGKILYFGKYDGDSDAFINMNGPNSGKALAFMIKKIEDANGNYILFEYRQDKYGHRVTSIKYTGNNNGITPYNKINFYYEERKDITTNYINGSSIKQHLILNNIKVYCENLLYRQYNLKYLHNNINDDIYSRLVEVSLKNSKGDELNSTIIQWNSNTNDFEINETNLLFGCHFAGDFNGDGLTDLIRTPTYKDEDVSWWKKGRWATIKEFKLYLKQHLYNSNFTFACKHNLYTKIPVYDKNTTIFVADVDGDGKDELINKYIKAYNWEHRIKFRVFGYDENTNSFVRKKNLEYMAKNIGTCILCKRDIENVIFRDFDGDGADEVFFKYEKHDAWYIGSLVRQTRDKLNFSSFDYDADVYPGDFNGDGAFDILALGNRNVVYSFSEDAVLMDRDNNFPSKWHEVFTGDFNGDGRCDVLTWNKNSGWHINFFKGNSFAWPAWDITLNQNTRKPNHAPKYDVFIADYNGDGKADILESVGYKNKTERKFHVSYSTGEELIRNSITSDKYGFSTADKFSDYNGDGKIDLVIFAGKTKIVSFHPNEQKYLAQSITDGIDKLIQFEYKSLIPEGSFYYKLDDDHQDINGFAGPIYVVSQITSPDGIGGTNRSIYRYKGAKIHTKGKGFLGFEYIRTKYPETGILKEQEYDIMDAYMHTVLKKTITSIGGNPVSEKTLTYNVKEYGKCYFPYIYMLKSENYLKNTTLRSINNFDHNGNLTTNIKTYGANPDDLFDQGIMTITTLNTNYTNKGSYMPYKPQTVSITKKYTDHSSTQNNTTFFSYDTKGNITSKTENAHTTDKSVITYFENYDKFGNFKRKRIAPNNMPAKTTTYEFDYNGRFVYKQTSALGSGEYTYNHATGNVLTKTGITGLKTTYQYDNWGRRTKTILPDGQEINYATRWYTGTNVPHAVYFELAEQDGAPYQKTYYDILGRTVRDETVGFNNRVNYTRTTYNNKGQMQEKTSSLSGGEAVQSTTYTYKPDGRPETTTLPTGKTITNNYGTTSNGYTVTKIVDMGSENRQYTKEYDAAGNLVKATDPGGEILYKYHANGQVKKITLANSEITMEYDNAGNQTVLNDPDAGRVEYDYNALGDLTYQKDNKGNEFWLFYDNLWRLDKKTTDQAGTNIIADYSYVPSGNGIGKVQQVSGKFSNVTRQYEYDQYHRTKKTIETIGGQTFTNEYYYDEHGNIHRTDYDNSLSVTRDYDGLGFLNTVKANGALVWDRANLSAKEDKYFFGNNILANNKYDDYGFPNVFESGFTSPMQQYNYDFNTTTGNLLSRTEQNGMTESFAYDDLDRLTNVKHDGTNVLAMQYNQQDKHNMNSKDNTGDIFNYSQQRNAGVHAVTSIEGLAPDAENLPEHDITWTDFNKVDQISEPANNKHMYFTYGPEQQRKKVQYVHNHWVYDRYYSGNREKTITYGNERTVYYISGGSGLAAAWVKDGDDENLYFIHTDHLGSIRVITDQNRNIVARYSFDAWGNRRNPDTWQLTDNPDLSFTSRGFTGHEHIDEFGLINMNGRVYDPITGQFLSPDNYVQMPDYSLGFNRYAYALNNPLIYTDPNGEWIWLAAAAFVFLTEPGYQLQKYVSPVAIKININFGTHQTGLGYDVSVGLPKLVPFSYRYNFGDTYYWKSYGGYKGWENRRGHEYSVLGVFTREKTKYTAGEFSQTVGTYTLGIPGTLGIDVNNDLFGDKKDRWRTSHVRINLGLFRIGNKLFTGEPDRSKGGIDEATNSYIPSLEKPDSYRHGILYVGVGPIEIGWDSEAIRNRFQNTIHKWIDDYYFEDLRGTNQYEGDQFYFQFGWGGLW